MESEARPSRFNAYWRLMRFDRPIGIYLLWWPMLWALWYAADGIPNLATLAVFLTGGILMRAAGCVINDYADRKIDGHVERTRNRPLATGELSSRDALILFAALMLAAFVLVLMTNRLTIYLSFGGALLAASYPFSKRYIWLPQVYLGAAFAWSVPMAYAAQSATLTSTAWLLYLATVLWTTAYDTLYAMVDRDDDLRIGVRSSAILFGEMDRLFIGILQILALAALLLAGERADYGLSYQLGLLAAGLLFIYQQWLIRDRSREGSFKAFLNNHYVGMMVFVGLLAETWNAGSSI
jgi:4-hydroxybenzoate polyprenyltransferase